ncbi:hypothetical protein [Aquimarina pacifica]|uniref:hypothetical protein n=1 Tax=Aquimarina pacifica TaxID=1296415 RepID=UPI000472BEC4|nr:hypothetical protein [Aquimarina pacifica]
MKNVKVVFAALVIIVSSQVFANNTIDANPKQQLRQEITTLLEAPKMDIEQNEVKANVEFTLNANGEIVVLTVNSEKMGVDDYVKGRLNYKKIKTNINTETGKIYRMRLKILKS